MNRYFEKAYTVTNVLPPSLSGRIDLMRPSLRAPWGGPLNGQVGRRQIVRDIAKQVRFDRVLETGTYRGTSTEFFAAVLGVPVETAEVDERFYLYSKLRLAPFPEIGVHFLDSRQFLRSQAGKPGAASETVLIYLDAHWGEDLPLAEELLVISGTWHHAVVMIDDFQVPGDEGYGFDDYGPGKCLNESLLPTAHLEGWSLHYPAIRSSDESGARRGSCILSSPEVGPLTSIPTLHYARTVSSESDGDRPQLPFTSQ